MARRVVLVHGAWHGAWCWHKLIPLLRAAGHDVTAPDLPGHGDTPSPGRVTLRGYADFLAELLHDEDGDAVLVGHSLGGMAISAAAQLAPERIATLVYLAAFLPRAGDSVFSLMEEQRAEAGPSPVEALMHLNADRRSYDIDRAGAADVFYNGCEPADAAAAVGRLAPQPLLPLSNRLEAGDTADGIPRFFIACRNDRVIPLAHQRRMAERRGCRIVVEMDTGHSPFLERPDELADVLGGILRDR